MRNLRSRNRPQRRESSARVFVSSRTSQQRRQHDHVLAISPVLPFLPVVPVPPFLPVPPVPPKGACHPRAPARFFGEVIRSTGAAVFFLFVLIESRLLRSASIRFTTFGGASISCATISRPSIFASMM